VSTVQKELDTARWQLTALRAQVRDLIEQLHAAQRFPLQQLVTHHIEESKQMDLDRKRRETEWAKQRAAKKAEREQRQLTVQNAAELARLGLSLAIPEQ